MPAAAFEALGTYLAASGYAEAGAFIIDYSAAIATVIEVGAAIAAAPCQHRAGPATSPEASQ